MKSSKIDIQDSSRVLLTDLLPYETPVLFTNEGLHGVIRDEDSMPELIKYILDIGDKEYRIPYTYIIKNGEKKYRKLSVIHPAVQTKFIGFYEKYSEMILYQCSISPFTLRAPSSIASKYFERTYAKDECIINEAVEEEREGKVEQLKYSSSFFAYKKYNFLYKFYDSYEFIRLEKKFNHLLKIDLSKCFDSIYTHSLSWAVKSKEWAKNNIGRNTFENDFDVLMQKSNYNETNGIVIGPEVSRIFAEIILQRIDLNVLDLLDAMGLKNEKDYAVRRYIDDYFIFYNIDKNRELIFSTFQKELSQFRFYINESKTIPFDRPFITNITTAKTAINWLCERKISPLFEVEKVESEGDTDEVVCGYTITPIFNPSKKSNLLIRDIKSIVNEHEISFSDISSYFLSIMRRHFDKIINSNYLAGDEANDRKLLKLLLLMLDVSFFIYSMDVKVRTTYIITQIIVTLAAFVERVSSEINYEVKKKILDESLIVLKRVDPGDVDSKIEILNLLIALNELGEEHRFDSSFLQNLFFSEVSSDSDLLKNAKRLDYFQSVVILYYIGDSLEFKSLSDAIYLAFIEKFIHANNPFQYSEYTCMFFDLISWPFGDQDFKDQLIKEALKKKGHKNNLRLLISETSDYIHNQKWFISWDKDGSLMTMLKKKELRTPY